VLPPDTSARDQQPQPLLPAAEAFARELMPLRSTGVDRFLRLHPTYDGRGVVIAVLDGGIDPGIPGLRTTSTGERKILDLRDFSGEGIIALQPLVPRGDSALVAGHWVRGFGRVLALNAAGPYFGGALQELALGQLPAADVNGNGSGTDTLPLVVTRASDGWVVLSDAEGDGSLANDRPVHDFQLAKEFFGWNPPGRPPRVNFAASLTDSAGAPRLDVYFDGYSHGSHVAGIAAGNDLYGVTGFDGVAPGAQLLGLKIARDAQEGVSVTGAIVRAMDYAIRFAAARRRPLVINLSFGLANAPGVEARIDQLVDSILAGHPEVVMCVSAGNDGPGLGTVSSPASAERVIAVGATLAGGFRPPGATGLDPLMYFSSRGGPMAKPDLVAPGVAYSSVPGFDVRNEVKQGTSMASPHVAGLVALLLSGLSETGRPYSAALIRQALTATARPSGPHRFLEEGAGLPDVAAAFHWLETREETAEVRAQALGGKATAAYRETGLRSPGDTIQEFQLIPPAGAPPATLRLRSDAPWLASPLAVSVAQPLTTVAVRYRAELLRAPGVYSAVVTGWGADSLAGPVLRLVNTVAVPYPAGPLIRSDEHPLGLGQPVRVFFPADSGRPFEVTVRAGGSQEQVVGFLTEPSDQPYLGANAIVAGGDQPAASVLVDGRDARSGIYEATAVGWGAEPGVAAIDITQSPVALRAARNRDGLALMLSNLGADPIAVTPRVALVGGERRIQVIARGSEVQRMPLVIPGWADSAEIDVTLEPAQWARLTDLGISLFDSTGAQITADPARYPRSRVSVDLRETSGRERPVVLSLFPGFAQPEQGGQERERWTAEVVIRLYANAAQVTRLDGGEVTIAPQGTTQQDIPLPAVWLPQGDAFFPLAVVEVAVGGRLWTRQVGLPEPKPPLAR
jgi:subtilisin family serine protease